MYGLIGSFHAHAGQRDALIDLMAEGIRNMPGCLSYIIAKDVSDDTKIWVTEVWDSKDSHAASLKLPAVTATITKAMPLIAGFGEQIITTPVSGHNLAG